MWGKKSKIIFNLRAINGGFFSAQFSNVSSKNALDFMVEYAEKNLFIKLKIIFGFHHTKYGQKRKYSQKISKIIFNFLNKIDSTMKQNRKNLGHASRFLSANGAF